MNQSDQLCNLCGHSCYFHYNSIGVDVSVSGAYYSTPGNGFGALDDMVGYLIYILMQSLTLFLHLLLRQRKYKVHLQDMPFYSLP